MGVVHLSILKLIFLEVLHHNYSFKIQQAVIGTQVNCSVECPNMFLFPNQPDISDTWTPEFGFALPRGRANHLDISDTWNPYQNSQEAGRMYFYSIFTNSQSLRLQKHQFQLHGYIFIWIHLKPQSTLEKFTWSKFSNFGKGCDQEWRWKENGWFVGMTLRRVRLSGWVTLAGPPVRLNNPALMSRCFASGVNQQNIFKHMQRLSTL